MWYTVQRGDTLFSIARRFNTMVESIIALNNLTNTSLTVGQRIRIPLYTEVVVRTNDSNVRTYPAANAPVLARMVANARLHALALQNGWYRVSIYNGKEGWIPANTVTRHVYGNERPIEYIVGFYTIQEGPSLPSSFASFNANTGLLSEVPMFMFRINRNNPTTIEKFGEFSDQDVNTLVAIGHRNNVKMLAVVHNLLYHPGGQTASKDVVKQTVATPASRAAFVQELIRLIQRYNLDGVNIDIEDAYLEDKDRLNTLYTEIGAALHRYGYFFSASVPARVSDQPFNPFSDPFDYAVIGRAVDQFIVMLYNEHGWPGSGPGPVVSIGWMNRVLSYTITKMPKEKVIAAVSVFGFDFNLTTNTNTYVTYQMAMDLSRRYNVQVTFDRPTQTPMFSYRDAQGNQHQVWFENAQSILAKAGLAWRLGIGGLALWRLGMEDPGMWAALDRGIVVRKF